MKTVVAFIWVARTCDGVPSPVCIRHISYRYVVIAELLSKLQAMPVFTLHREFRDVSVHLHVSTSWVFFPWSTIKRQPMAITIVTFLDFTPPPFASPKLALRHIFSSLLHRTSHRHDDDRLHNILLLQPYQQPARSHRTRST